MVTSTLNRKCRICLQYKAESSFRENGRKIAKENRCKECINKAAALRRELKKKAPKKPDHCECCKRPCQKLCLDHCHKKLSFRGWICEPCNRGIGQLGDDIEGLVNALNYLLERR